MDKEYWNHYYSTADGVHYPTTFAEFCIDTYIPPRSRIVELGVGNARDAFYFAEHGHFVIGVDQSCTAIEHNQEMVTKWEKSGQLTFVEADFAAMTYTRFKRINVVYSRFSLHAITEQAQHDVVRKVEKVLPKRGLFLIECRTTRDPMFRRGKRIGRFERFTDHYRRFIRANDLLRDLLSLGFSLRYFVEDDGLAVHGDDDPVVARYVVEK